MIAYVSADEAAWMQFSDITGLLVRVQPEEPKPFEFLRISFFRSSHCDVVLGHARPRDRSEQEVFGYRKALAATHAARDARQMTWLSNFLPGR
jgi:hypothetical protein